MKIRTDEELFDRIDAALSWRKTDMTRHQGLIIRHKSDALIFTSLLRTAIPIIYAHWEGFIKEASVCYLQFISIRKFKFNELNLGMLSLYLQTEFLNNSGQTTFERANAISNFYESQLGERSEIMRIPEPIKAKSNLNSSVLKEIVKILDLEYEPFRGFENFIDFKLLEARNGIAHGEYREIDWDFYNETRSTVISLLEEFRTQIQNQVVRKKYFRTASLTDR